MVSDRDCRQAVPCSADSSLRTLSDDFPKRTYQLRRGGFCQGLTGKFFKPTDFTWPNEAGGIDLNETARRLFLSQFEKRLSQEISHPDIKSPFPTAALCSYRSNATNAVC